MKKLLLALAFVQFLPFMLKAQDPVIMEVGGQQIKKSEFMKEFNTNVGNRLSADPNATPAAKQAALEEYVELFANFRAKILDAKSMGYDTSASLKEELAKYRAELAAPYLIDSAVLQGLLTEAYERNHYSLRAAHILVPVSLDADPADTLAAWNRIVALRERVMNGEDFYAVAADEMRRQRPNNPVRPNEGELGYFTAFDMVYPFETAAYAMQVGEISQPVRTRYGYHIIKLIDRVAMHGKCDMAHIWIGMPDTAQGHGAIRLCSERIKNGESFESVASMSDDRMTRDHGGMMPNATLSNLPPEYIHQLEHMKAGEVSEPFYTQYGWHIIKLIRKDTLASLEEMTPYYKQRMVRDQRGSASRRVFAQGRRARYGIVDNTKVPVAKKGKKSKVMMASLDEMERLLPIDSLLRGKWSGDISKLTDMRTLVTVGGRDYNAKDFAEYVASHQKRERDKQKIQYYLQGRYEDFLDSVTVVYADSRLEEEYPEFAALLDDYRRGLMIFDYNEDMVWAKAIRDSAGFADYYSRASLEKSLDNPSDSVFFWHERARLVLVDITDSTILPKAKAVKVLNKALKKQMGSSQMREMLDKALGKNYIGRGIVKVDIDMVERTRQDKLRDDQWQRGVYLSNKGKGYRAIVVEEIEPRTLKAQMEARGYYLNEYQNEVERQLNERLRQKYNVKIYRDVVESISY